MTKFDKELITQIKGTIKFLENTTCEHPGVPENKVKTVKEYVGKLNKKFDESKK
jgi:hypothetical protein